MFYITELRTQLKIRIYIHIEPSWTFSLTLKTQFEEERGIFEEKETEKSLSTQEGKDEVDEMICFGVG